MQFNTTAIVHGIKESKGQIEGRAYSSTTFHIEVDLQENSSGRSIGTVTRPFKLGTAEEFDKWAHLSKSFPIKVDATFELGAGREDSTSLKLVALKPTAQATKAQ